jgi:2-dehydropantoate 2-reductase
LREGVRVLRANEFPVEPPALKVMLAIPDFILVPLLQRILGTELLDIGGSRHANNARDEMRKLNEELFSLARKVGMQTPAMIELHRYSDPSVPPAVTG